MARILGLFGSALAAARLGGSQRAWEREVRAQGLGARSSEMLRLWRIAKEIAVKSPEEPFRPQHLAPSEEDLSTWPSKKSTGIAQTVTLTYRDKTTGEIKQTWWRTVGESALTREQAIATAIDAYSEHAEQYNQDLIGAVHTSAYRLVPGLFES